MQYAREPRPAQLELVHHNQSLMHSNKALTAPVPEFNCEADDAEFGYSEICLNGAPRQCLKWLAPVLRDLSQAEAPGWLTLLDPPEQVSHAWLRQAGLDPWRILIVRPNRGMDRLALCCEILRLGYSHTVVSWLSGSTREVKSLDAAARSGNSRCLNVRLDVSRAA
ncbi:SulA-like leucine-rich domain-containing protein [Pseudomonas sp.]|jgi:cell division inhibitor SulA|uniref:SulA-like leucine-rich domain-containing protein n=1 Tax=Pseudomonas sp. TaxID=306 RepID=UPI00272C75F9|nr:SulA-like leucine-rich domain-containing protein [Pseudomonas sp.]